MSSNNPCHSFGGENFQEPEAYNQFLLLKSIYKEIEDAENLMEKAHARLRMLQVMIRLGRKAV